MSWTCVGLGLLLLAGSGGAPAEKTPVPLYTNEDLDRVSRYRAQTGVESDLVPLPPATSLPEAAGGRAGRGEQYWRREAEKLRTRLRPRLVLMEELRARIAEREAHPGVTRPRRAGRNGTPGSSGASSPASQLATWRGQLAALEREVREEQDRLEERARRAGALPGWLR